jgi:signal peptidase I
MHMIGESLFFQRLRRVVWELICVLAPALLIALFVNVYVAEAVAVKEGPSMQPNLYIGYRVMTEKISYRLHPPYRGDIVVVDLPSGGAALIKRVVGLPGDVVQVTRGHTWINGRLLDEPWVAYFGGMDYGPARVPPAHLFIMGDNRVQSLDSRAIGPVPMEKVRGRAWMIYWPLDHVRLLR